MMENRNLNHNGVHLGELRADRQYIVIASSKAKSKIDGKIKPYCITKDVAPAAITKELLQEFLKNFDNASATARASPVKSHKTTGGGDRSRYDFAKCCELLEKDNLSFIEICDKMKVVGSSKWQERDERYKMLTFRNAMRRVKQ